MIELKITGEDPATFQQHVLETLRMVQQTRPAGVEEGVQYQHFHRDAKARQAGENLDGSPRRETVTIDGTATPSEPDIFPASDEVGKTEPAEKKPRGRPAKKPEVQAQSDETVAPATFTVDDMRNRVREIIAAHKKRGYDDPDGVAYCMKLFGLFGIKKISELPADRFVQFMSASAAYLDGTAPALRAAR